MLQPLIRLALAPKLADRIRIGRQLDGNNAIRPSVMAGTPDLSKCSPVNVFLEDVFADALAHSCHCGLQSTESVYDTISYRAELLAWRFHIQWPILPASPPPAVFPSGFPDS